MNRELLRMRHLSWFAALSSIVLLGATSVARPEAQGDEGVRPSFAPGSLAREWTLDGTGTWAIRDGGVLALAVAGTPGGPIRRPSALALVNGPDLTDTSLRVDVRSTAAVPPVTPRRDVILVVNYQSPTRFYYVHVSAVRDDVHNGIFVVHDADRRRIDTRSDVAPLVDEAWHQVHVRRTVATGQLQVFVDDMTTPIMVASDTTLTWGRAGVGSFDDTAEFRRLSLTGTRR